MSDLKDKLADLVEICKDSTKGYETAAENVENPEYKTLFNRLAQQRKLFVEELKQDARTQGIEISESGSVSGFFHRNWLSTKAFFSSNTTESVIDSAITGEEEAMDTYKETIDLEIPKFIRTRLEEQLQLISGAIEQLHGLRQEVA